MLTLLKWDQKVIINVMEVSKLTQVSKYRVWTNTKSVTEISGCREPRVRIHCVTGLATGHRPRCLGICWWIQVSQGHLLYVTMFNPERSVPQVSKVVEMLFCCLIALKRAFPCPVRVMHGLGNVLAHQGIRFGCLTGRKLRKLSDRSTNWTGLSTTVGKGNDQGHTPMSTW